MPNRHLATLEQPQGRDYRAFHEGALPWIGGVVVLGMIILIAAFYLLRGPVRMQVDQESDRTILRFNVFELFILWLNATCFVIMAKTGLTHFYQIGRRTSTEQ